MFSNSVAPLSLEREKYVLTHGQQLLKKNTLFGCRQNCRNTNTPLHIQLTHSLCTAKTKYRNFETNIPRKGISGSQFQFPHSCVCERFICSHDRSAYSAGGNTVYTDPGTIYIAHRHMKVETGAEAALFPEKEYINGIFVAVWPPSFAITLSQPFFSMCGRQRPWLSTKSWQVFLKNDCSC